MKQKWQGYKHINGSYQAKPAWVFDVEDAMESNMVVAISDVVEAEGRTEALELIKENIEGKNTKNINQIIHETNIHETKTTTQEV